MLFIQVTGIARVALKCSRPFTSMLQLMPLESGLRDDDYEKQSGLQSSPDVEYLAPGVAHCDTIDKDFLWQKCLFQFEIY
jgi:hypothetical protein